MLKTAGAGGLGVLMGASGLGGFLSLTEAAETKEQTKDSIPFYGKNQAGITTDVQDNLYFAALNVTTESQTDVIQLFKEWTEAAAQMTKGKPLKDSSSNAFIPPKDTGEAAGLSPSNLTITFGVGPSLFVKDGKDRFGLKAKQPEELRDLPAFPLDALEDSWSGGDICIQACADDLQVAFHAVRNLVRIARGKAVIHWAQTGFQRTKQADSNKETPRNLFGFKDGTINPNVKIESEMNQQVWVQPGDGPNWLVGGSYMVVRRIQMFIEVWDRTALGEQEKTFGRHRDTGAPLGLKNEFETADFQAKDATWTAYDSSRLTYELSSWRWKRSKFYAELIPTQMGWIRKQAALMQDLLFICFQRIQVNNLSRCKNVSLKTIS